MTFDLENAVQQGFNRDVTSNDWNVEATNLEIVLGDRGGGTKFEIKDVDHVTVAEVTSDGYLSVLGNAEVHGGNLLVESSDKSDTEFITLRDEHSDDASIFMVDGDPNARVTGTKGSLAMDHLDGYLWINIDDYQTWTRLSGAGEVDPVTLHQAYKYDLDGADATILTDATDGAVKIAGTEKLWVTATGGFDLDSGFDQDATNANFTVDLTTGYYSLNSDMNSDLTVDGANLTLETTTSGDIIIRVPATGGDFVVDEGIGIDYIRAETVSSELRLGNIASGTGVDVKVLSNLTVDGDLVVEGTTTTINTEDLYVEDRLIRLNTNAAPSFSGTVGIEAEVGSDGYVEFHWDDTQSRWELSIDRNTTPEAQTFRPIPYLADLPATLDLSDTGTDGFPTLGPNPDAGASVINTNATNFPNTFGPDMTDDSVQAALEAIDGYFVSVTNIFNGIVQGLTLQDIYDQSCPDPTIVLSEECGSLYFDGTEQVVFNNDNGVVINNLFLQEGGGPFTVDIDNEVNIASNNDVNIYSSQEIHISGEGGIVLDGYGENVIPATSCTDSLGDPTHGWTDLYVCRDGVVIGLNDEGDIDAPNNESGAYVISTNSTNFFTFGPDMTSNTVQAALEAIDGYLEKIIERDIVGLTLQDIYNNSCGDATIVTSPECGPITFEGTEQVIFNNTGGVEVNEQFIVQGPGPVVIDVDGEVNVSSESNINITSTQEVHINGELGVTVDGYGGDIILQGDGQTIINNFGGLVVNYEFLMEGDGPFVVDISGPVNISSEENINLTSTGEVHINGEQGIVLDGYGENVIPANSCTDSLGDPTHGWTDIFLCSGSTVIGLNDPGDVNAPNTTSGASVVGTSSTNFETFGPDMTDNTVQAALEAIDGYFRDLSLENMDTVYTKKIGLDINGAVLNGVVKVSTDGGTPALDFNWTQTARASWAIPVPSDWDMLSDITVEFIWSPASSAAGDVEWRLEYKSLTLTELASSAVSTDDYTQAAGGTADAIQSTGENLTIPAGAISSTDEIIVINVVRRGAAAGDTYQNYAQLHLVKYSYSAQNIV